MAGRFLVLDGPDGCGKSTQAKRLVDRLRADGRDVLHTREPGGTRTGEAIRALLLDPSRGEMTLRAELLLYMASRAQIVEEVLRPALAADRVIVCERYLSSSIAYQGVAGGLGADEVARVGAFATGGLAPDVTVILDIDPSLALDRLALRYGKSRPKTSPLEAEIAKRNSDEFVNMLAAHSRDRIEARPPSYQEVVRQGFLDLASKDPSRYFVVDARGTEDEVAARVWQRVQATLA